MPEYVSQKRYWHASAPACSGQAFSLFSSSLARPRVGGAQAHHLLRRKALEARQVPAHAELERFHIGELARQVVVLLPGVEIKIEELGVRVALQDPGETARTRSVRVIVARRSEQHLVLAATQAGKVLHQPVVVELAVRNAVGRKQERRLVDAVDVPISGKASGLAGKRKQRGHEVVEVKQAIAHLPRLDHSRPAEDARHSYAALPGRALRAAKDRKSVV